MKKNNPSKIYIFILFVITILSTSCEKEDTFGGRVVNAYTKEPVPNITMGLYYVADQIDFPDEFTQFEFIEESVTDQYGYFTFSQKFSDMSEIITSKYIFIKRSAEFDSSEVAWQYYFTFYNDRSYFRNSINWCEKCTEIEVFPSGRFELDIVNRLENDTIEYEFANSSGTIYSNKTTSNANVSLEPYKKHAFDFYKIENGKRTFIEKQNIYIKNSFNENSSLYYKEPEALDLDVVLENY